METLFLILRILVANPVNVEIVHDAYDVFAECSDLACDSADNCVPTWTSSDPACSAVALVRLGFEQHSTEPTHTDCPAGGAAYRDLR